MTKEINTLLAFCAALFLIALSPGLCMTLALTLGIGIGVRRSLWMMAGETTVATVGVAALAGVTALMLARPEWFAVAIWLGAAYRRWSAVKAWRFPIVLAADDNGIRSEPGRLPGLGFVTAASNPKA